MTGDDLTQWLRLSAEVERVAALRYPEDTAGHFHEDFLPMFRGILSERVAALMLENKNPVDNPPEPV